MGNPTFVDDLARWIIMLISNEERGMFNIVNEGAASRYEYVKTIVEYAGLDVAVYPVDAKAFDRVAPVSDNESAINLKLMMAGYFILPSWKDSLNKYIKAFF